MAKNVRVRMNSAGARQLLNSPEVISDLEARAIRIKEAADGETKTVAGFRNDNYYARAGEGTNRAHAHVIAANPYSISHNMKRNILIKSMDAGR